MKYFLRLLAFFAFIFVFSSVLKAQPAGNQKGLGMLAGKHITGAWRINIKESDDLITTLESLILKVSDNGSRKLSNEAIQSLAPPMSFSLIPPEFLIIASSDSKLITINEGFAENIVTRTLTTDGKLRVDYKRGAVKSAMVAIRMGDFVKVETISPRENTLLETYVVTKDGTQLIVKFLIKNGEGKEAFGLRRVYDRTILNPFTGKIVIVQKAVRKKKELLD